MLYRNKIKQGEGRAMIEVNGLSKAFIHTVKIDDQTNKKKTRLKKASMIKEEFLAVSNVSFNVKEGEIFGILGPNGAGKTTLLRMLGGILTPTAGDIKVAGFDYTKDRNMAKREIGYLSGNTKLYGRISPRELMTFCGNLYEMKKEDIENKIEEIIHTLDMREFADNRIEKLSTGQMQRTSIARCLLHSPKVYIFDEPTLGLDVLSSHAIIEFMKKEKKKGKTVLYSTHYMEEAETLCDHIVMLHKGEVIATGKVEELKRQTNTNNLREAFVSILKQRGELE